MSPLNDAPTLPFNTPPEVWAELPPEARAQLMQMELSEAQARHAAHRAELASADQQTWGAAHGTIRLLMGLNAGAIVAILAFLGSMISGKDQLWLPPLITSLIAFLLGATFSVIASAIAYFAGSTLVTALQGNILSGTHPYVFGTDESDNQIEVYNWLRWIGVGFCVASGFCALIGSGAFLNFAIVALDGTR